MSCFFLKLIFLCLSFCASSLSTAWHAVAASCPLQFQGRVWQDANLENTARLVWSGAGVQTRFQGQRISARFYEAVPNLPASQRDRLKVYIDDLPPQVWVVPPHPPKNPIVLAENLPAGEHTIRLVKITEANVGAVLFQGFFPDGEKDCLPLSTPPLGTLEIIGDSISAGYGNLGKSAKCHFSPATEDVTLTYGYLLAHKLGLEPSFVVWSGKGLWRNGDGTHPFSLPELWGLADPFCATCWQNLAPSPKVYMINLGTNDWRHEMSLANRRSFEDALHHFLIRLREHAPQAFIFVLLGPMLSPPMLGKARLSLSRVVHRWRRQDKRLFLIELPMQDILQETGCDMHPNQTKHQQDALFLEHIIAPQLKNSLGPNHAY